MQYKSKEALNAFLEVIRNADFTFLNEEKALDNQGKIDGYQHLFHLLSSAIDFYLFNDPLEPTFMPLCSNKYRKILGDNVDAVYYFTQLRGDQEYLIRGKRYDSCYLSFATYGGEANGEIVDRVANNINHTHIDFEEDGSFEIKLTQNPQGKNEFKLDSDVVNLFTREYFFDRFSSKESELSIINTKEHPSQPLSDNELAKRISTMATFFEQTTWLAPLPVDFPINDFLPPFPFYADQGGWGTVDNTYCFGKFKLEENQYLKINFTSPDCCYWGIQTWNYLMQSMDYQHYPVCINKGTAQANEDGSYTIYVSSKKPNHPNWISTANYNEAILFCRWLLAEELPQQPTVELLEW